MTSEKPASPDPVELVEIVDGVAVRLANYADVDEARAAAERLAAERE